MAQTRRQPLIELLGQGSPEAVLSVTPNGRILLWTRRAQLAFGYTRAEAIGRQCLALVVSSEGVESLERALAAALATGSATCLTIRRRKDRSVWPPLDMRLERHGEGNDACVVFYAGKAPADAMTLLIPPSPTPLPVAGAPARPVPVRADEALWGECVEALASSFSPEVMLQRVCALTVPRFADWSTGDLLDLSGLPRRVAAVHREPSLTDALGGEHPAADLPLSSLRVIQSARPVVQMRPTGAPASSAELVRVGEGAHIVLPLIGRAKLIGAISFARIEGREFTDDDVQFAHELARRASVEIENAILIDHIQRLRETARHATERARQLVALSHGLSEALTPEQVTAETVQHARVALGATGGAIAMLSSDHANFEVPALVGDVGPLSDGILRFPIHANLPLADAARSGDPVILDRIRSGAPRYAYLAQAKGPERALAAVPLIVDGRRVGALGLMFPERRIFHGEDLEFMGSLARHAADALERARLYGAERGARALADAEARRSAFLADASRILASSFDYQATLESMARLCVPGFAHWCAVYLREKDEIVRPVAIVHPDPTRQRLVRELLARNEHEPARITSVAKVIRTGRSEVLENVPAHMLEAVISDARTREIMSELGMSSQVVLPLIARGRTLGAIALCSSHPRRLTRQDLDLIQELAGRAALAVDNARLYHEVEHAYRLQEETLAALRESEERYRFLVDAVPDYALFLLDEHGLIQSWNTGAERLLGYTAEEVIGRTTEIFFTAEDIKAGVLRADLDEAVRQGSSEAEGWRVRKDGTRYWSSVLVTALRDEAGNVRGFSKLHRNITERRDAREALDLASQRLAQNEKLSTMGTLVSGVAHEIRTPLTVIANSIHLLQLLGDREDVSPDALKRHTSIALEGVDRINALVQDLRRFKRTDSVRAITSLHEVVDEALNLFRAAHRGHAEVIADLVPTPLCPVDRAQIQQVVLNLLQNASEAMPLGGTVVLSTGTGADGSASLTVRDEGLGMSATTKARMFEEFFTTKDEGTGLGLSIVRRIVELHHGRIECGSELGKGTTFTLLLPAQTQGPGRGEVERDPGRALQDHDGEGAAPKR